MENMTDGIERRFWGEPERLRSEAESHREFADDGSDLVIAKHFEAAADEIERLRSQVEFWQHQYEELADVSDAEVRGVTEVLDALDEIDALTELGSVDIRHRKHSRMCNCLSHASECCNLSCSCHPAATDDEWNEAHAGCPPEFLRGEVRRG